MIFSATSIIFGICLMLLLFITLAILMIVLMDLMLRYTRLKHQPLVNNNPNSLTQQQQQQQSDSFPITLAVLKHFMVQASALSTKIMRRANREFLYSHDKQKTTRKKDIYDSERAGWLQSYGSRFEKGLHDLLQASEQPKSRDFDDFPMETLLTGKDIDILTKVQRVGLLMNPAVLNAMQNKTLQYHIRDPILLASLERLVEFAISEYFLKYYRMVILDPSPPIQHHIRRSFEHMIVNFTDACAVFTPTSFIMDDLVEKVLTPTLNLIDKQILIWKEKNKHRLAGNSKKRTLNSVPLNEQFLELFQQIQDPNNTTLSRLHPAALAKFSSTHINDTSSALNLLNQPAAFANHVPSEDYIYKWSVAILSRCMRADDYDHPIVRTAMLDMVSELGVSSILSFLEPVAVRQLIAPYISKLTTIDDSISSEELIKKQQELEQKNKAIIEKEELQVATTQREIRLQQIAKQLKATDQQFKERIPESSTIGHDTKLMLTNHKHLKGIREEFKKANEKDLQMVQTTQSSFIASLKAHIQRMVNAKKRQQIQRRAQLFKKVQEDEEKKKKDELTLAEHKEHVNKLKKEHESQLEQILASKIKEITKQDEIYQKKLQDKQQQLAKQLDLCTQLTFANNQFKQLLQEMNETSLHHSQSVNDNIAGDSLQQPTLSTTSHITNSSDHGHNNHPLTHTNTNTNTPLASGRNSPKAISTTLSLTTLDSSVSHSDLTTQPPPLPLPNDINLYAPDTNPQPRSVTTSQTPSYPQSKQTLLTTLTPNLLSTSLISHHNTTEHEDFFLVDGGDSSNNSRSISRSNSSINGNDSSTNTTPKFQSTTLSSNANATRPNHNQLSSRALPPTTIASDDDIRTDLNDYDDINNSTINNNSNNNHNMNLQNSTSLTTISAALPTFQRSNSTFNGYQLDQLHFIKHSLKDIDQLITKHSDYVLTPSLCFINQHNAVILSKQHLYPRVMSPHDWQLIVNILTQSLDFAVVHVHGSIPLFDIHSKAFSGFDICITVGKFRWSVRRRFSNLLTLQSALKGDYGKEYDLIIHNRRLMNFFDGAKAAQERCQDTEGYLNDLTKRTQFLSHPVTRWYFQPILDYRVPPQYQYRYDFTGVQCIGGTPDITPEEVEILNGTKPDPQYLLQQQQQQSQSINQLSLSDDSQFPTPSLGASREPLEPSLTHISLQPSLDSTTLSDIPIQSLSLHTPMPSEHNTSSRTNTPNMSTTTLNNSANSNSNDQSNTSSFIQDESSLSIAQHATIQPLNNNSPTPQYQPTESPLPLYSTSHTPVGTFNTNTFNTNNNNQFSLARLPTMFESNSQLNESSSYLGQPLQHQPLMNSSLTPIPGTNSPSTPAQRMLNFQGGFSLPPTQFTPNDHRKRASSIIITPSEIQHVEDSLHHGVNEDFFDEDSSISPFTMSLSMSTSNPAGNNMNAQSVIHATKGNQKLTILPSHNTSKHNSADKTPGYLNIMDNVIFVGSNNGPKRAYIAITKDDLNQAIQDDSNFTALESSASFLNNNESHFSSDIGVDLSTSLSNSTPKSKFKSRKKNNNKIEVSSNTIVTDDYTAANIVSDNLEYASVVARNLSRVYPFFAQSERFIPVDSVTDVHITDQLRLLMLFYNLSTSLHAKLQHSVDSAVDILIDKELSEQYEKEVEEVKKGGEVDQVRLFIQTGKTIPEDIQETIDNKPITTEPKLTGPPQALEHYNSITDYLKNVTNFFVWPHSSRIHGIAKQFIQRIVPSQTDLNSSSTMLHFIDQLFDLHENSFMRKRFVWMIKILFQFTGTQTLDSTIQDMMSPSSFASHIDYMVQVLAGYKAPQPPDIHSSTFVTMFNDFIQHYASSALGQASCEVAAMKLTLLLQCPVLLHHVVYSMLDIMLKKMFPDIEAEVENLHTLDPSVPIELTTERNAATLQMFHPRSSNATINELGGIINPQFVHALQANKLGLGQSELEGQIQTLKQAPNFTKFNSFTPANNTTSNNNSNTNNNNNNNINTETPPQTIDLKSFFSGDEQSQQSQQSSPNSSNTNQQQLDEPILLPTQSLSSTQSNNNGYASVFREFTDLILEPLGYQHVSEVSKAKNEPKVKTD